MAKKQKRSSARKRSESIDQLLDDIRVLAELRAIINADIRAFFDSDGRPKRIQELPEELRLAIQDCEVDPITGRIRSVTLKNKIEAAEQFFRMHGKADKPEVAALLKAAKRGQQRFVELIELLQTMRDPATLPKKAH